MKLRGKCVNKNCSYRGIERSREVAHIPDYGTQEDERERPGRLEAGSESAKPPDEPRYDTEVRVYLNQFDSNMVNGRNIVGDLQSVAECCHLEAKGYE